MLDTQIEAIRVADEHTSNAELPYYSELLALARRLACPDAGELLTLGDYRSIARNVLSGLGRKA